MLLFFHVDEVQDDDAAQIAQPQLTGNGLRGLQVGLEDRVVEIAAAHEAARIDVHRRQRLRLVDDQVAARLQIHPARQGARDLVVHIGGVEQWSLSAVMLDPVHDRRRIDARPFQHSGAGRTRIHQDGAGARSHHVA
ncbi:hypothetical protein D3C86_1217960 [compost metagenome]